MWTETHRARLMSASALLALGLSLPAHANAAGMLAPGPVDPTPMIIQIDGEDGEGGKSDAENNGSDPAGSSDPEGTGSTGTESGSTDASGTDSAMDPSSTDSSDTGTATSGEADVSSEIDSAPDGTGSSASDGSSADTGENVDSSGTGVSSGDAASDTVDTSPTDTSQTQSDTTTSAGAPAATGAAAASNEQSVDVAPAVEPPSPASANAEIREAPASTAPLPSIIQPARDSVGRVAEAPALCKAGEANCVSSEDTTAASSAMSREMQQSKSPALVKRNIAVRPATTAAQQPALAERSGLGITLVDPVRDQNQIVVQGIIVNTSSRVQAVPPMRILLKNKAGQNLRRWETEPPVAQLAPGQQKAFKAVLKPIPSGSSRVDVAFIASR